jgi:hypothetical protein
LAALARMGPVTNMAPFLKEKYNYFHVKIGFKILTAFDAKTDLTKK